MSRSQDYIAKIRYQNDLPPPVLPPRLLNYSIPETQKITSSSLLSSLYRKENINNLISIDNDLGSPIDLVALPYVFDLDSSNSAAAPESKLHENDRFLLRDPGIDKTIKSEPNVAFLRRTEYTISTKTGGSKAVRSRSHTPVPTAVNAKGKIDTQLHSIESSFEKSTTTLKDPTLIKHPLKKNLKVKKVWSLLPDVSRMDQIFSTVRFANNRTEKNEDLIKTSILRVSKLNNQTDWCSFYVSENETVSNEIRSKLENLNESLKIDENDEEERYKYSKEGDYAFQFDNLFKKTEGINEIALRFDDKDDIVYYNPIKSKGELKRRKLQGTLQELYDEFDLDELNVKFKEPTVDELDQRNHKRHKFDDVTYESIDKVNEDKLEYEEKPVDQDEDDLELIRKQNSEF